MFKNLNFGIPIVGDKNWIGGIVYSTNLVSALRSLLNKNIKIIGVVTPPQALAIEVNLDFLKSCDSILFVGDFQDKLPLLQQMLPSGLHSYSCLNWIQSQVYIDFLYPLNSVINHNIPNASWIPDFQHHHLPEFFLQQELDARSQAFHVVTQNARLLVLSSEDARSDLLKLYPDIKARTSVLHFRSVIDVPPEDPRIILQKYKLPEKFLLCCNQFWTHKDHITLFNAIAHLHKNGLSIFLVCTGATSDYRNHTHYIALLQLIDNLNIKNNVKLLGYIPRSEQIALMRCSAAMVQPSLFEGWSTVLEDARSLGLPVIASDLGVHIEQDLSGAKYFKRRDVASLCEVLSTYFPDFIPGPQPERERAAQLNQIKLLRLYGEDLLTLAEFGLSLFKQNLQTITFDNFLRMFAGVKISTKHREQLLGIAVDYHTSGQLDNASEIYQYLLNINSDDFVALHLQGVIQHQNGNLTRAEQLIKQALTLNYSSPEAHYNLGNVYLSLGRKADAHASFKIAVDLNSNFDLALKQLEYTALVLDAELGLAIEPDSESIQRAPTISIITSVFNGDKYIRPFLMDITRQSIFKERCELILVNANSPGSEEQTIFEFMKVFPRNIFYKRLATDPGIYACWNMAIEMATGEFITNANLDDRKSPTFLEELANELLSNVGVDIVYANNLVTNFPNETWEKNTADRIYLQEEFSWDAMLRGNPPHCMPMWRRNLHEKFGLFEEEYRSAGDWEFWLRCAAGGAKALKLNNILGLYYFNPNGISTDLKNASWKHAEELEIFRKYSEIHKKTPAANVDVTLGSILFDAVFFQLYQTGIARVWRSLLREWAATDFGKRLVVLDRAKTAPRFEGLKYIDVPRYDYADTNNDRAMLQEVCDAENAAVFISSYYTTPLTTPSVFLAHDMIPETLGADVVNTPMWREKHYGVRHAKHFLAVSKNTASDLRRFFPHISAEQVTVAHNGVDFMQPSSDAVAEFRAVHNIQRPYFLLVGARDGYKNAIVFFKAFASLGALRGRYAIVCTGPILQLEAEYAAHVGNASVHMLNLSDEALQAAYAGALALVYPSLYEGFGMPIVEAMACGCPVITTRKGSIPEIAGDAVLYVAAKDVQGLSRALKQVQKADIRARLIAAGLKRARGYSWKKMADQVRTVLEQVAAQSQAHQPTQSHHSAPSTPPQREQALGVALQLHQSGQIDQADAIYLQLLGQDADDFVALHLHGVAQHQRGEYALAEQSLLRALAINRLLPEAHYNLGNVYLAQGRAGEARACFKQALALNPEFSLAKQQLAAANVSA